MNHLHLPSLTSHSTTVEWGFFLNSPARPAPPPQAPARTSGKRWVKRWLRVTDAKAAMSGVLGAKSDGRRPRVVLWCQKNYVAKCRGKWCKQEYEDQKV